MSLFDLLMDVLMQVLCVELPVAFPDWPPTGGLENPDRTRPGQLLQVSQFTQ